LSPAAEPWTVTGTAMASPAGAVLSSASSGVKRTAVAGSAVRPSVRAEVNV
jgi:hypothetical protein